MEKDKNFQLAVKLINERLLAIKDKYLSAAEITVLEGSWRDEKYEEMALKSGYALNYLQHGVAPQVWELLSEVFPDERRIGKKKVRPFLEKMVKRYSGLACGNLPDVSCFFGREAELLELKELIFQKRLIYIYGVAGIGKSALAAKLLSEIEPQFDFLIWKPVAHSPKVEDLIASLCKTFIVVNSDEKPDLACLVNQLQQRRCLVVLDRVEAILNNPTQLREYINFFLHLFQEMNSCLVMTGREYCVEVSSLSKSFPVASMKLEGLDTESAIEIFESKGLDTSEHEKVAELIEFYQGNPLELTELAEQIIQLYDASIEKFYEYKTTLVSEYSLSVLEQIFKESLTPLQREILTYVAESMSGSQKCTSFFEILETFNQKTSQFSIVTALKELEGKFLIERINSSDNKACYKLPRIVRKYILPVSRNRSVRQSLSRVK